MSYPAERMKPAGPDGVGPGDAEVLPKDRLEALFGELSELAGQRNAIDGRIVEIGAEIDGDRLWGMTPARSVAALVAWRWGASLGNAHRVTAVAGRSGELRRCVQGLRDGRLSLDQVGVIVERAGWGSDAHYAQLAESASLSQLRTAIKLESQPDPDPAAGPVRSVTRHSDGDATRWRVRLGAVDAAMFDAALRSHLDALVGEWRQDRDNAGEGEQAPPLPGVAEAFLRLGCRGDPPPARPAHHDGDASRGQGAPRRVAPGPAAR